VVSETEELILINHRAVALLGLRERVVGRPFHELEICGRPAVLR